MTQDTKAVPQTHHPGNQPQSSVTKRPTPGGRPESNSKTQENTHTSLLNHINNHNNKESPQHQSHNVNYEKYKGHNSSRSETQSDVSSKDSDDYGVHESRGNLGWLITPIIFLIACLYVLYRCISDGLCKCRRFRRLSGILSSQL